MATTTTNYGWDIPQSTDLVKDGATAIAALGQDIDTALVDLKGGTTGQVLAKASGTDLDFSWVAQDDSNAIQNAIVDAKGDLIGATAADTPARLAVGANGTVLTADSAEATGLKWATPAAGGMTLLSTTTLSGTSVVLSSINQTYTNLFLEVYGITLTPNDGQFRFGINGNTSAFLRGSRIYQTGSSSPVTEYVNGYASYNNLTKTDANNTFNMLITDYTNTSAYKQVNIDGYYQGGGAGWQETISAFYTINKDAITSLTILNNSAPSFAGGTARLWGIK
jgi:hypothetical protein